MWRFKQFMPKEQAGLEGRTIDIGNLKINVRNVIAEGGFSCVYLARDAISLSKQYALKHIICKDEESLDLVKREISVMKSLKGHPNTVTLHASAIFGMGQTKEALLVLEFCEKSLVGMLENRGSGYFEEKQVLSIFRDVCNAVFALHCQSPPIAHRDLKAENVLLGHDGAWKLCDFGSTSTNHKRFDRPEEMGIEEDIIRKHTTPAYRAPEMWDLFRKEVISEKVDIWALGCLLYRICYFKSAFDGESKLQILNGNYRIPELPKYSSSVTELIQDMLQASPDVRPDITQVWFHVNHQLPPELQKELPDMPASDLHDEGNAVSSKRPNPMPQRSPPPPPILPEQSRNVSTQHSKVSETTSRAAAPGGPLGAFWSTQHAQNSQVSYDSAPVYDEPHRESTSKYIDHANNGSHTKGTHGTQAMGAEYKHNAPGSAGRYDAMPTKDFEINFFPDHTHQSSEKTKPRNPENVGPFQNETFNAFVAEFDTSKLHSGGYNNNKRGASMEELEAEVEKLREELKEANLAKDEIASRYDKLTAICHSQRQEIQELMNALAAKSPSPNKGSNIQNSSGIGHSVPPQREKIEGSLWEVEQGMSAGNFTTTPESKSWQAFADQPKTQAPITSSQPKSVRTTKGNRNMQSSNVETWGFGQDNFRAIPGSSSEISRTTTGGNTSLRLGEPKNMEQMQLAQPAGWAGF